MLQLRTSGNFDSIIAIFVTAEVVSENEGEMEWCYGGNICNSVRGCEEQQRNPLI
jgi:hypothetical protein